MPQRTESIDIENILLALVEIQFHHQQCLEAIERCDEYLLKAHRDLRLLRLNALSETVAVEENMPDCADCHHPAVDHVIGFCLYTLECLCHGYVPSNDEGQQRPTLRQRMEES